MNTQDCDNTMKCPYCRKDVPAPESINPRGMKVCPKCGWEFIYSRGLKIVYITEKIH